MNNIIHNFKEEARRCLLDCIGNLQSQSFGDVVVTRIESFILAGSQLLGQDSQLDNAIRIAELALSELVPDDIIQKSRQGRGRPAILIDLHTVEHLLSMNFRGREIARMMSISSSTLFNKLRSVNYSVCLTKCTNIRFIITIIHCYLDKKFVLYNLSRELEYNGTFHSNGSTEYRL